MRLEYFDTAENCGAAKTRPTVSSSMKFPLIKLSMLLKAH
jgi:hypothetical protein